MRTRAVALVSLAALLVSAAAGGAALARDARPAVRDLAEARRGELPDPGVRAFLGIVTANAGDGLVVQRVIDGSAADRAGLRAGDVIRRLQGNDAREPADLDAVLQESAPGDAVRISLVRGTAMLDREVTLGARRSGERLYRGPAFRLAVIPLRFADDPAGGSADDETLASFFFARTGSHGAGASLRDYYAAQSLDALDVDGRVFPPLRLTQDRAHYAGGGMGAIAGSPYREAGRLLVEAEEDRALRAFDGIVFLYDGPVESTPGRALWPHRAVVSVGGRRIPYYVHSSETVLRGEIGEHCHEFGHLLGLEDMYGIAHRTGAGDFCVMAIGHRGGPQHGAQQPFSLCAACRVRLGWVQCVTVDPATPQRLRIAPGDVRGAGVLAIPFDRRTSEYLLLEARARRGFDAELPSTGLLVWRVGGLPTAGQGAYGSRVDLVEAHGIDTFDASLLRPDEIAFPTARAADLTPTTCPASSSLRAGAFPVHLTDIVREADGSVVVTIGVPGVVEQTAPAPYRLPAGRVVRTDPITGDEFAFDVSAPAPRTAGDADAPSRR